MEFCFCPLKRSQFFSFKSCGGLPPPRCWQWRKLQLYINGKQPVTNCFPKRPKEPFCLLRAKVICFRRNRTGPHLRGAAEKAHLKYWGVRSRGFSPPPAFLLQMVGGLWLIHGHFSSLNSQALQKQNNVLQFFTAGFSSWSFGSVFIDVFDNSPTTDCSVLLYPVFVDSSSLFWVCYVKITQVASKEVELIKLGFLQFLCAFGFFSLRIHLNGISPSEFLPSLCPAFSYITYAVLLPMSLWPPPWPSILCLYIPWLYEIISEVRSNIMLWI